jgi:hypothetical protein
MKELNKAHVGFLLSLHGYEVPEPDLAEVTHRINALIESLQGLDALDVYHVEPWPMQPLRRLDDA